RAPSVSTARGLPPPNPVTGTPGASARGGPSRTLPPSATIAPGNPANVYAAPASGVFSPAVAGIRERVYVPNTKSGTVSVIDPKTYRVIRTLVVGGVPHHITPSWDLRHLYVDNPGNGLLEEIDPKTARLGNMIRVPTP